MLVNVPTWKLFLKGATVVKKTLSSLIYMSIKAWSIIFTSNSFIYAGYNKPESNQMYVVIKEIIIKKNNLFSFLEDL